jgi:probable phosphoglycerate mutase
MKLHLVRHGQTNWNAEKRVQGQSESELDTVGRQQAEDRRATIEALGIGAIYSSTSLRTRQTTDILAGNINVPVRFLDSLREIHLGPWETQLWSDLEQTDAEQVAAFKMDPQIFSLCGAESYVELQARGVSAIEGIIEQTKAHENILVVSHGAILLVVLAHYAGIDFSRLRCENLKNCSHSVLEAGVQAQRRVVSLGGIRLADSNWA